MEKEVYITEEEREKCRRVAYAFEELYELTDTVVFDTGKYGFVKLQYYNLPDGFDSVVTYRDSETMFKDLWGDWLFERLVLPVLGTPMEEFENEDIFKCLPQEKQEEIIEKRKYFEERSNIINPDHDFLAE